MMSKATVRGVGLIEVLVTLLIMAVGMMGIAAMQVRAQQSELESYQRSQAMLLVDDMVSRINANRSAASCYITSGYIGAGTPPAACTSYASSPKRTRAENDLQEWVNLLDGAAEVQGANNVGSIEGARGCITSNIDITEITVTVAWQGSSPGGAPPAGIDCAAGQFGGEEWRRVVSSTFYIASLDLN